MSWLLDGGTSVRLFTRNTIFRMCSFDAMHYTQSRNTDGGTIRAIWMRLVAKSKSAACTSALSPPSV